MIDDVKEGFTFEIDDKKNNNLEGKMSSHNVSDSRVCSMDDDSVVDVTKDTASDMVDDGKESDAGQLVSKPLNDHTFRGDVKVGSNEWLLLNEERLIDGNVVDDDNETNVEVSGKEGSVVLLSNKERTIVGKVADDKNEREVLMSSKECSEALLSNEERTIDGNGVDDDGDDDDDETEAVMSDKEVSEADVLEGGVLGTVAVKLVVDLEVCVGKKGKGGKKKGGFCASDLVWAKVKSHPWWPGQIFEPGDASDAAMKHFRSKSYLVAYFGDNTFAWNDEIKLKPFLPHFLQMVTQTNKEAFRNAVKCALDEVSRRVQYGLSCHCIVDSVYDSLKTQAIENAGIRESSRKRECGDRVLTCLSFEPVKFLDYVRSLAQGPLNEVDKLEHVMASGQMAALYRWKGCYQLAEFGYLVGYVNNEADAPNLIVENDAMCNLSDAKTESPEGTKEKHGSRTKKRKNLSGDDFGSPKTLKCVSDFMVKGGLSEKDEKEIEGKSVRMSSSLATSKKAVKMLNTGSKAQDYGPSPQDLKPSFSVGASILRVAGQLSQPSPLLKFDISSHAKTSKAKSHSKPTRQKTKVVRSDKNCNKILSDLHNAAVEPLKDNCSLSSMAGFFTDFRKSIVPDCDQSQKDSVEKIAANMSLERSLESGPAAVAEGGSSDRKSKVKTTDSEITTKSIFEDQECVQCTEKAVSVAVQDNTSNDDNEMVALDPKLRTGCESDMTASERGQFCEKSLEDDSPTALTLKFSDMDSIPSEAQINKIFRQFGPLKESETDVLKKKLCARVVFKRRIDAETAFSSSGKFETFGPSLVCYQLNYAPSPRKHSSVEAKRRKKDESLAKGDVS